MNAKTSPLSFHRLFGNRIQRAFVQNPLLRGTVLGIMIAASVTLLPSVASAQNAFLKLEGLKGESTEPGHKEEIEILGFTSGIDHPLPFGEQEATKPQFYEVRISKKIDITSPMIFVKCATGEKFKKAFLSLTKSDAKGKSLDFFKIELTDVTITRVSTGGSGESATGGIRNEEISLAFQKIEWIYIPIDPKSGLPLGPVKGGYDLANNKPL